MSVTKNSASSGKGIRPGWRGHIILRWSNIDSWRWRGQGEALPASRQSLLLSVAVWQCPFLGFTDSKEVPSAILQHSPLSDTAHCVLLQKFSSSMPTLVAVPVAVPCQSWNRLEGTVSEAEYRITSWPTVKANFSNVQHYVVYTCLCCMYLWRVNMPLPSCTTPSLQLIVYIPELKITIGLPLTVYLGYGLLASLPVPWGKDTKLSRTGV